MFDNFSDYTNNVYFNSKNLKVVIWLYWRGKQNTEIDSNFQLLVEAFQRWFIDKSASGIELGIRDTDLKIYQTAIYPVLLNILWMLMKKKWHQLQYPYKLCEIRHIRFENQMNIYLDAEMASDA